MPNDKLGTVENPIAEASIKHRFASVEDFFEHTAHHYERDKLSRERA
jgi:hypothetical protein